MLQCHNEPAISIPITSQVQGWEIEREVTKDDILLISVSHG